MGRDVGGGSSDTSPIIIEPENILDTPNLPFSLFPLFQKKEKLRNFILSANFIP